MPDVLSKIALPSGFLGEASLGGREPSQLSILWTLRPLCVLGILNTYFAIGSVNQPEDGQRGGALFLEALGHSCDFLAICPYFSFDDGFMLYSW